MLVLVNRSLARWAESDAGLRVVEQRMANASGFSYLMETSTSRLLPVTADLDLAVARSNSVAAKRSLGTFAAVPYVLEFVHPDRLRVAYLGSNVLNDRVGRHVVQLLEEHRRSALLKCIRLNHSSSSVDTGLLISGEERLQLVLF